MERPAREQQAWDEVGHTEVRRPVAFVLAGLGLAGLLVVASLQLLRAKPETAENPLVRLGRASLAALASGEGVFAVNRKLRAEMQRFEATLEETSWLQDAALPVVQGVLTGWGRVGNEQVYVGREGWLFFRPDVDLLTGSGFLEPGRSDALAALLDFHRQLEARGIALVVVPVPPKTAVAPWALARRAPDPREKLLANPSAAELVRRLETAGIEVLDPWPQLLSIGREPYLRTDSHWRPEAMDAVAAELARRLEGLGLGRGELELRRESVPITAHGDLVRMLELPQPERWLAAETAIVQRVLDAQGQPWQSDPGAEVLLLGDSFTNVFSQPALGWGEAGGLAEQLSYHLGRPIDRLAINDGGDLEARRRLAQDLAAGNDRLAGKRVVVYQFAARELAAGDWQPVELPAVVTTAAPVSALEILTVRARVEAVALLPEPGTTPYRDALLAIHLVEIEALGGGEVASEVLVYVWGLRDGRPTAAASWRREQQLELRLVPWSQAPPELESLQRFELPEDELLFLDTFWVETDDEKTR